MKFIKALLLGLTAAPLLNACLDDDGVYNAGFVFQTPRSQVTAFYANNEQDSIVMVGYGDWRVNTDANMVNWLSLPFTTGKGNYVYAGPVTFGQNTTGNSRVAQFTFVDVNHPDKASATIYYLQYATRGDGSLGNAPAVKSITGSDGTLMTLTYDRLYRPLSLKTTKDGATVHNLTLRYNDIDSVLTVTDGGRTMRQTYGNDYQPGRLVGETDTVGYYTQWSGYVELPVNYAFNVEDRRPDGQKRAYAYLLNGQSLSPDSLHNADSLKYIVVQKGQPVQMQGWKCIYTENSSNLTQSVDVNHLALGLDAMDPYQLLSLFRYARSSRVLSQLSASGQPVVSVSDVVRNGDLSIRQMTVQPARGEAVTYTFEY